VNKAEAINPETRMQERKNGNRPKTFTDRPGKIVRVIKNKAPPVPARSDAPNAADNGKTQSQNLQLNKDSVVAEVMPSAAPVGRIPIRRGGKKRSGSVVVVEEKKNTEETKSGIESGTKDSVMSSDKIGNEIRTEEKELKTICETDMESDVAKGERADGDQKIGDEKVCEKNLREEDGKKELEGEARIEVVGVESKEIVKEEEEWEEMLEWEDTDDYLTYLDEILSRLHRAYYEMADEVNECRAAEALGLLNAGQKSL